jgi:hypothetical protein
MSHRSLPAVVQLAQLVAAVPGSDGRVKCDRLVWRGDVRPLPATAIYTVEIAMPRGAYPRVRVVDPELQRRPGEPLPHIYEGGALCLFSPGEWNDGMSLAHTVLPWISEWLYYYELWLFLGDFIGDSHRPAPRPAPTKATPQPARSARSWAP